MNDPNATHSYLIDIKEFKASLDAEVDKRQGAAYPNFPWVGPHTVRSVINYYEAMLGGAEELIKQQVARIADLETALAVAEHEIEVRIQADKAVVPADVSTAS